MSTRTCTSTEKMASYGETTREYQAIQRHYASLVDNLGKTVDPAHFARKLREKSLISESAVEAALVTTVPGSQRVGPAIDAVLAQIKLKADIFNMFMSILKIENSCLADTINESYSESASSLEIREQCVSADVPAAISSEGFTTDRPQCAEFSTTKQQVHKFESRFADLVFRFQTETEEKKTPVKKFRNSITLLPIAIKNEHLKYVTDSLKVLKEVEDIELLFMHLNLYWNFFDYNLLEHLITSHGSAELKEEMTEYRNDMEFFRKETTVELLLKVCPGCFRSEAPPPNFTQVIFKLDRKASDYTLEELEELRRQFCSNFSLSTFALMLASVRDGSVTIVWHIPSSEVHRLCNTTVQWNSISTDLLLFEVDGLLLEFAWKFDAQAMTEYTALTHLYLDEHYLGADEIAILLSSLKDKSHLQHVDLRLSQFGSEGAKYLAEALTANTALTYLQLPWCGIDTDGIAFLSQSLRNKSHLQYVNLSGNKFGSEGAKYLAQALTDNTALTHLCLSGCGIDTDGIAFLSSSLRNKSHLQYVNLKGNEFGSDGAKYLAKALTENTALTYLNLWGCGIGSDGIAFLSSSLRNKSHLQHVDLSGNQFGSEGAKYLAQALTENTALTQLDLSFCGIGADGMASLSLLRGKLPHVGSRGLNLLGNEFEESSYTEWWKVSQSGTRARSQVGSDDGSGVCSRHSSVSSICG